MRILPMVSQEEGGKKSVKLDANFPSVQSERDGRGGG